MKKKKFPVRIILLVLLLLTAYSISFADVITYPDNLKFSFAATAELIMSYEHVLSRNAAGLFWLGGGFIQALKEGQSFLFGSEAALAFRYYFKPDTYDKFFFGVYGGSCVMYIIHRRPYDYNVYPWQGVTFGAKLGYKKIIKDFSKSRVVIEPYTSIATSFLKQTRDKGQQIGEFSYPLITLGVRFVYEWIPKKK